MLNEQEIRPEIEPVSYPQKNNYKKVFTGLLIASVFVIVILFILFRDIGTPPENFPVDTVIHIEEGMTISEVADFLLEKNLINSATYFTLLLKQNHHGKFVQAANYMFPRPLSARELATALTNGEYAEPAIAVTFYEGVRGEQIVAILGEAIPELKNELSPEIFDDHIGYLFPDTYHLSTDTTVEEIITLMTDTFDERTRPLADNITRSRLSKDDIVILASIIEREANTEESMKMISGILHNRLKIGMALQVDATFEYLLGKASDELTEEDLEFDSPYNTYRNTGLPPGPISNPGLMAIKAALNPTDTSYMYYITGSDGTFYYAETFEEHKRNKELYL